MPLVAQGAERDYLLRWFAPQDPDIAGYEVYLALESMSYGEGLDIGYVAPDPNGIASFLLEGLDAGLDYYVVMTAYDAANNVSGFSNEIVIRALACDPSACNDGDPCTADGCSGAACTHDPVPDGTACDDGEVGTVGDYCEAGVCAGILPVCSWDAECDDGDICTTDRCVPEVGCFNEPGAHGAACGGRDACTPVYFSLVPTRVPDQSPLRARIVIKNLDRPAGRQGVVVAGFFNPATTTPEIDPSTNGVHFHLQNGEGVLYAVSIPGGMRTPRHPNGLCNPNGRDGWQRTSLPRGTVWTYNNLSNQLPASGCAPGSARGIYQVVVKDLTRTPWRAFQYIVRSRNDTLPYTPAFPVTSMQAELTLAAPPSPGTASEAATLGQCAKSVFNGSPVPQASRDAFWNRQAFCKGLRNRGRLWAISCRGL
jgi:hypothetical protein